jgi:hypothetical protein
MALAHLDLVDDERTTILLTFSVYNNRPKDATAIINNIRGRKFSLAGFGNPITWLSGLRKNDKK